MPVIFQGWFFIPREILDSESILRVDSTSRGARAFRSSLELRWALQANFYETGLLTQDEVWLKFYDFTEEKIHAVSYSF